VSKRPQFPKKNIRKFADLSVLYVLDINDGGGGFSRRYGSGLSRFFDEFF
jgi:hypothetical protein